MRRSNLNLIISILFFVLLSFVIQSCAPSSKITMLADENALRVPNATLAINLLPQDVIVDNSISGPPLKKILGNGDLKQSVANLVKTYYMVSMRSKTTFAKVFSADIQIGSSMDNIFTMQMRPASGGDIQLREPKQGSIIPTGRDTARFILFIDRFRLDPGPMSGGGGYMTPKGFSFVPGGGDQNGVYKLYQKFQFYVWDNRKGTTVFYGTVANEIPNGTIFTESDFNVALDKSVDDIFGSTPFSNVIK